MDCNERLSLSTADLVAALRDFYLEQKFQGVGYAEVRISPRRFMGHGIPCRSVLNTVNDVLAMLANPTIRAVFLVNRDSSRDLLQQFLEEVTLGLPEVFVGIDLAGDEIVYPELNGYAELFDKARDKGLGVTVHAGEFGAETAIWAALDVLGAGRIGHGLAAACSRALRQRLAQDQVLMEMSLISNLTLGAIDLLSNHPLPTFLDSGIPVSLNCDVPVQLGSILADEYRLAADLLGVERQGLDLIASRAMQFRFGERS